MKLIAKLAMLFGGVAAVAPSAFAQDTVKTTGVTWSVGYGYVKADDGAGSDLNLGAMQVKAGYRFHPNFGVEGEYAWGANGETVLAGVTPVTVKIDREYGAFAVGYLPLNNGFDLFARVGYVDMQLEAKSGAVSATAGDTGTGYGAGALWNIGGINLRAEYTRYDFGDTADAITVSIGSVF